MNLASRGTGITPGGGGAIGSSGLMQAGEQVFFGSDNSIKLHVGVGDDSNGIFTTGYLGLGGQHARHEFSDLSIAGQINAGFQGAPRCSRWSAPSTGTTGGAPLPCRT